jgi:alpha-1,2-mannosyltransferase
MEADRITDGAPGEAWSANGQPPGRPAVPAESGAASVVTDRQVQRWLLVVGVVVFAASTAGRVVLDLASSSQRWNMVDLQVYRWGGLLVRHSGDLYGSRFPYHHLYFTYPPIAALIFVTLSVFSISVLGWLFTAASIISLVASFWMTWGALGYRRPATRAGMTLLAAGVALRFGPVQDTLGFGQVNLILMVLIIADFCLPGTARAKGAGVGLAAGFKLTPLIFIPYLLLTRRFRAAGVAVATFGLTIVVSLILLPGQSGKFWFGRLFLDSSRPGGNASVANQSLHGALERLLGSLPAAQPYWAALPVIVGVVGLLLATRWAKRGCEMTGVLICALTGLLVSPVSWPHHWVWAAPALAVAVDMMAPCSGFRRRSWACWLCAVALAAPFFVVPHNLAARPGVQGLGTRVILLVSSNLYVIVGLMVLCIAAFGLMVLGRHGPQGQESQYRQRQLQQLR